MELLTPEVVTANSDRILNKFDGDYERQEFTYLPISYAYIRQLLLPFVQELEIKVHTEAIMEWLRLTFPEMIYYRIVSDLGDNPDKNIIITSLLGYILGLILKNQIKYGDDIITPWDIQNAIQRANLVDRGLSQVFGITQNDDLLLVTVIINNQSFTHKLSQEFTIGLLIFSIVSYANFDIKLFGESFTTKYLTPNEESDEYFGRYVEIAIPDAEIIYGYDVYTIKIGKYNYKFKTPDFIRGFETGSLWMKVNHRDYWTKLIYHYTDPKSGYLFDNSLTF